MRIIDLTQTIDQDMPVYPGTDQPIIELGCTLEQHGFEERRLTLFTHTGTHLDAPAHLISGGRTLDRFEADHFIGPACVLDVRDAGAVIQATIIERYARELERAEFALLLTGWDRYWGQGQYFDGYPTLSLAAAELLAGFGLKGVGMDCISPDPVESAELPVHRVFFAREMVIAENLTHLEQVPSGALFSALPLKIRDADGSPARAVALLP